MLVLFLTVSFTEEATPSSTSIKNTHEEKRVNSSRVLIGKVPIQLLPLNYKPLPGLTGRQCGTYFGILITNQWIDVIFRVDSTTSASVSYQGYSIENILIEVNPRAIAPTVEASGSGILKFVLSEASYAEASGCLPRIHPPI